MTRQQQELIYQLEESEIKNALINTNWALQSFLLGFIDSKKKKSPSSEIKLIEGENMKYKNIKIKKSENGVSWFARFRKNNKQYYISDKTQLGCYNKVKETYQQKEEDCINSKTTLIQWYEKWLEIYKTNVRETTLKEYKNNLKHINEILNKPIKTIKTIDILQILANIPHERQKQKVYEFLNDLFNKALINEIIVKNPMLKIEKPKHKKEHVIPFNETDEKIFEQYCLNNEHDLYLLALWQGLRPGEALAIQRKDLDFENKIISINGSLDIHNQINKTKNEYSVRKIPMRNKTYNLLQKYKDKKDRIFEISKQTASRQFKEIVDSLFPNNKYQFKSLRSTFITMCQEKNIPLHITQNWVGHVLGSSVTNEVYTKTRNESQLFYFNKIND